MSIARNAIQSWDDVPLFCSEEEERDYWEKNEISHTLIRQSLYAETGDSATITLRMDPRMLARIKRLARLRYLNYQSMIKQWLAERIEKEL